MSYLNCDLSHEPGEGQSGYQHIGRLLIPSDLHQGLSSGPETSRLSGGGGHSCVLGGGGGLPACRALTPTSRCRNTKQQILINNYFIAIKFLLFHCHLGVD